MIDRPSVPAARRGAVTSRCAVALAAALMLGLSWSAAAAPKGHPAAKAKIPEAQSEVYIVTKVRAEEAEVKGEIDSQTVVVGGLTARMTEAIAARAAVDRQARIFNDSAESQQLAADRNNYIATCAGKMLYGADIGRCESAHNSIQSRLDAHNNTFAGYTSQFNAQDARAQDFSNQLTLANAKITKLRNYLSWLTAADDRLATSLSHDCKGVTGTTTLEELKHRCGNIQFDGATANLRPCDTERCQAFVLAVQPARTPEQAIAEYKKSGPASPTKNPHLDKGKVPPPPTGGKSAN